MKKKLLFGLMAVLLAGVGFGGISRADCVNASSDNTSNDHIASINTIYYCTLEDALNAATEGQTIKIISNINENYNLTHLGSSNTWASNLTIEGSDGVTVGGLNFNTRQVPENLTIKDVNFDGNGFYAGAQNVTGLTISGCVFNNINNEAAITIANGSDTDYFSKDITIKNNIINVTNNGKTAIYIHRVNGLTVEDNTISGGYNAIQNNLNMDGDITIRGNTFSNIETRNLNLAGVFPEEYNGTITIENNSFCFPNAPKSKSDGNYVKLSTGANIGLNTYEVDPSTDSEHEYSYYFTNVNFTVTVTFNSNGGNNIDSQYVLSGAKVAKPVDPTKGGYTFDKWYSDETLTTAWDFDTPVTKNITLYAKWEQNKSSGSSGGGGGSRTKTTTTDDAKVVSGETNIPEEDKTPVNEDLDITSNSEKSELELAYESAYKNGITTMDTMEKADINSPLTRIAMAKMLSQYAINVLGRTPDISRPATFKDVTANMDTQYNDGVTLAYQLGIMGINLENGNFRPNDLVTRAEFGTALSRLLFGLEDGADRYYETHLAKLKAEGIISNDNPELEELRGYVMLMLMRSAK